MKARFISMLLAVAIFFSTSFVAPKAEAAVGLVIKNKVVKTIGGIAAGSGGGLLAAGVIITAGSTTFGWSALGSALLAIALTGGGLIVGGIGLIVLDDKQTVADVEFVKLTKALAPQFSDVDIAIYNSELDDLNAIRKTIQAEIKDAHSVKDANSLWLNYSQYLSAETKAMAEAQAANFINKR